MSRWLVRVLALCLLGMAVLAQADDTVVVGSKKFTEGVILGEIATQALRVSGVPARHRAELGGTRVLWSALVRGDIDIYAEYTGTLTQEIFANAKGDESLRQRLAAHGIAMSAPIGFADNYALAMRASQAKKLGISSISDLRDHPGLRYGLSNEFLDRADGWPGLARAYGLTSVHPKGFDHDIAYRAIRDGAVDVTDVYTTDAEIEQYHLRVLKDDRHYFKDYAAVWLYRRDLAAQAVHALARVTGRIDARAMRHMNRRAKIDGVPASQVAAHFLRSTLGAAAPGNDHSGWWSRLVNNTLEHLYLVAVSLAAAIVVAVSLGLAAAVMPGLRQPILMLSGILQTVPSLALLVIMVPLVGVGAWPAIIALFVYSLLPIVRNTVTGIVQIPGGLQESAEALGMPLGARLRRVYIPLALPSILAGIKTAAVINVGTATLGALVGAGGYGQPILTGIRLDDAGLILQGAIPAAVLALLVQGLFDAIERLAVPRGLRR